MRRHRESGLDARRIRALVKIERLDGMNADEHRPSIISIWKAEARVLVIIHNALRDDTKSTAIAIVIILLEVLEIFRKVGQSLQRLTMLVFGHSEDLVHNC